MNNLLPGERETVLSMTGDDHFVWAVFSDDPAMVRKLDKIAEFVRVVGAGKEYRLSANQVTIKSRPKPLSAERKAQLVRQAESMRKSLVVTSDFVVQNALSDTGNIEMRL